MNSMDENTPEIWTVSQLTRRVKNLLEAEISYVWVSGEISNWRVSPAGHAYFNLRDEDSQVDVVMFRGKLMQLRFGPENGLEVIIHGLVTVYEKRGNYQIVCDEMEPKGLGALQLAFEKLKRKLDEEGLFDEAHKKPLPVLPRRIGVVTSPTGAAIRDILNVLERRFANVHVILFPARVQGDEAAEEIVEGIRALDEFGVDVMIVGRGGGSLEDLWPFNEEIVVRAVYQVETPIISAVGHEIDFALTDFAADLRAPTPSAAAELVVQEREALVKNVQGVRQRMTQAIAYRLEQTRNRLALARSCYLFQRPEEVVRQRRQQLDELRMRLQDAATDPMSTWR
ncbi:MAG TPA: exodeoxyribonuclease VII large subunit, partial [Candidatus Hydrogenedentes bacterium]|nr:exodeoxyribonuclease VII large subunit [Candidatus Hydrogenedentota bacterium]